MQTFRKLRLFIFFCFTSLGTVPISGQDITPTCKFSCPELDLLAQPLVKRANAIGHNSFYSVFECFYFSAESRSMAHKCSYDKTTGAHRLGYRDDQCPPSAVPCENNEERPPKFSNFEDGLDVPPWVENGRYLLYLKEHGH
ncbi:hypothetical protein BDN70DRAFT_869509 [Pholiota conissans]|uniref:Uncharacterized protein n=1 Tax=Pholiota conissans TaxID=109636 RepID=A0A9P5YJ82_9AGAR|nr:hypothetical protein BDN70DRAFT_869509 [Pholiota conissans]